MHQMTRSAERATVRAPFAGEEFLFKGDHAKMESRDGAFLIRLNLQREGERLFRITRVIGGRYREDYVGVELPVSNDDLREGHGEERVMPVSYIYCG